MSKYSCVNDVLKVVWGVVEFSGFDQAPKVNSIGIFGNTPIKIVTTWGDLEAVKLLVENGANIEARLEEGNTPLHYAIFMGKFHIARYLINRGANQHIRNEEGKLPKDLCLEGEWASLFGDNNA